MQPAFHILSLRYISIAKLLISSTMALVMHPKPFICSAAAVHHHAQPMPAFPLRTWYELRFSSVDGVTEAVQDLCLVLEVDPQGSNELVGLKFDGTSGQRLIVQKWF